MNDLARISILSLPTTDGEIAIGTKAVNASGYPVGEIRLCPLCNQPAETADDFVPANLRGIATAYLCFTCGNFVLEEYALAASFQQSQKLNHHDTLPAISATTRWITERRRQRRRAPIPYNPIPMPILVNYIGDNPQLPPNYVGVAEILSHGVPSTENKLDQLLANLTMMGDTEGQWIDICNGDYSLAWARNTEVLEFLINQLQDTGYIKCNTESSHLMQIQRAAKSQRALLCRVQLTMAGLRRAQELREALLPSAICVLDVKTVPDVLPSTTALVLGVRMGLSDNALKILALVVPPNQQYANAEYLLGQTGLTYEALNDAVDELEEQNAIKPLRGGEHSAPGVKLRFAAIQSTVESRKVYRQRISSTITQSNDNYTEGSIHMPKLVFVSHKESDQKIAGLLVDYLSIATNLSDTSILCTSVPGHQLEYGVSIAQQLKDNVTTSVVLVALLSSDCLKQSTWVLFELGAAWATNKLIIPILGPGLTAKSLPGPLQQIPAIMISNTDAAPQLTWALNNVCKALSLDVNTSPKVQVRQQNFIDAYRNWTSGVVPENP